MSGVILSREFNEQIKKVVRQDVRKRKPRTGGQIRWHKKGGGGGGTQTVRFRIVAATDACSECFATARIISGPSNVSNPDGLPGTTYDDDALYYTIEVWDMGEGFLNHPPDELLNMIGHASWLRSYEDGPCTEPPGSKWEIISLQQPDEETC